MELSTKEGTKFTNAISGNRAIMLLYDYIGYNTKENTGIRGIWFAEEMYWHKAQGRTVCVYINSPGGQVYDGFSIIQAILDCDADTHIVGMAASMAGIISQFGKVRSMNDFAVGMIHPPVGGNEKLIEITKEQLKECLLKRSKLSEKKINAMMSDGEETWLDSSEMLDMGLVDEIVVTGKNVENKINSKKINEKVLNVNEYFKIYTDIINSLNANSPNPTDMDLKLVGAELGLENADQTAVINKIKEIKTAAAEKTQIQQKLTDADAAKVAAETAKTTAEASLKAERAARATELVENSILAGKIKEESKADYIKLAEENYDLAKKTLNGIQTGGTIHNSVHNFVDPAGKTAGAAIEDYESLAKNDPKKLQEIAEKEPAKFEKLIADFQAKSKKQ